MALKLSVEAVDSVRLVPDLDWGMKPGRLAGYLETLASRQEAVGLASDGIASREEAADLRRREWPRLILGRCRLLRSH